jgi:hypothetical protein
LTLSAEKAPLKGSQKTFVEKLLTSLNRATEPEIERLWAEEAEKRIAQIVDII